MSDPNGPGDAFVVDLWGEVDIARVAELEYFIDDYRASRAVDIVIDLRQVTFMDSTGLGFMARLHRDAKDRGGNVTVTHAHPAVGRVIRLSGIDQILVVEDDEP